MIGFLAGKLIDKSSPGKMLINVNGVGYDVETSLSTFFQLEQSNCLELFIHTIVREDAFLLYGFVDKTERSVFRTLIKVNGIGPKVAMGILSSITPDELIHAIALKNVALLTTLPGIGKKTAERLIIEMQDTLSPALLQENQQNVQKNTQQAEAICALEALGYKPQEIIKVIRQIDNGLQSCEQLIRQSLKLLVSRA